MVEIDTENISEQPFGFLMKIPNALKSPWQRPPVGGAAEVSRKCPQISSRATAVSGSAESTVLRESMWIRTGVRCGVMPEHRARTIVIA